MKNTKLFEIENPRIHSDKKLTPGENLNAEDRFADCRIERCSLKGDARGFCIERAALHGVRFEALLPNGEFEDVLFQDCDFSNSDLCDSIFHRVVFKNCRLTGAQLSGAALADVLFEDCAMSYANFHFARFNRVEINGCQCKNADFEEAALTHARLMQTDLRQSQFSGTPLYQIDLTSCDIDGLGARPGDLRGVILSPEQAITAAKIIGVIIRFPL